MFVEECRRAIATVPRERLASVSAAIWKAYAGGAIGEGDAQALAEAVEAKKTVASPTLARHRAGSRPRSAESVERRRRWTSSGWMPPPLAARFTLAEAAVLAVVAAEVSRHGRCTLTLGHIAALAGVCRTTVRNAMREARLAGIITVDEWRLSAWRSAPNTVKIVSAEWTAWLKMRGRGQGPGGVQGGGRILVRTTNTPIDYNARTSTRQRVWRGPEPQDRGQTNKGRRPLCPMS